MQGGDQPTRLGGHIGQVAFPQQTNFALQRGQVGRWLGIDQDHVTGHTAPGPESKGLHERAQQAQALRRVGRHNQQRSVPGNAEAPQPLAVTQRGLGKARTDLLGAWSRQAQQERGAERLDGSKILRSDAQAEQANAGQGG